MVMKLVIQIPCFNEAGTLKETVSELPVTLPGFDEIEVLVIDDGSTDDTVRIAGELGVKILKLGHHQGLAKAFALGLKESVRLGADIVVNTDADNQYQAGCIPELIKPILADQADIVVGCRPIDQIAHFSPTKKLLQKFGSRMVRFFAGTKVPDMTSGFRAYSRSAARKLRVFSDFSYTIETIIQAGRNGLRVFWVPITINPPTRPSRLFTSNWHYIRKQTVTIIRIWSLYSPVKLFSRAGIAGLGLGMLLFLRFIFYYIASWPGPSGKVQSLVIASILLIFGLLLLLIGVLADVIAINRKLLEDVLDHLDEKNNNR